MIGHKAKSIIFFLSTNVSNKTTKTLNRRRQRICWRNNGGYCRTQCRQTFIPTLCVIQVTAYHEPLRFRLHSMYKRKHLNYFKSNALTCIGARPGVVYIGKRGNEAAHTPISRHKLRKSIFAYQQYQQYSCVSDNFQKQLNMLSPYQLENLKAWSTGTWYFWSGNIELLPPPLLPTTLALRHQRLSGLLLPPIQIHQGQPLSRSAILDRF